ncbi:hypothetical protein AYO44_12520 [Planctomycetaceae bacterium SCGC AG-212-F19]|nr:hypothetical protein AYO44_12520 [Planctomycetaceae bacterium SCGC AG-212-F19]
MTRRSLWALEILAASLLIGIAPTTLLAEDPVPIFKVRPESDAGPSAAPVVSAVNEALCKCNCCIPHCGAIIGGVGLYLIQPYFETNPAYSVFIQSTGPGERVDITHHMDIAPLVWLGYIGENGVGVRGRWWYFRQDTSQTLTFPPGGAEFTVFGASVMGAQLIVDNPTAYNVTSKLQLQVADLEMVKNASVAEWDFLFSGGIRYADLTQNYNAYAIPDAQGPLMSGNSYTGIGPVIALEARYPLCECLSFYGSVRSALLFGSEIQRAFGIGTQADTSGEAPPGPGTVINAAHHDQVVAAEELEVGVEVHARVNCWTVFGQVAVIGQEWYGAGNASRSAFSQPPTGAPVFGTDISSNLGFFGLAVRLGINY